MKKLIIFFYCLIICNICSCVGREAGDGCDNPDRCTPGKITDIKAILSSSDTLFHVGDTIRFYARVPDTLITKEIYMGTNEIEKVFVKSLYKKDPRKVRVELRTGDSVTYVYDHVSIVYKDTKKYRRIYRNMVKYGGVDDAQDIHVHWKFDTREFECFFVFDRPGLYILSASTSDLAITTTNGRDLLLSVRFRFFNKAGHPIKPYYDPFVKHLSPELRLEALERLNKNIGNSHYFKVNE